MRGVYVIEFFPTKHGKAPAYSNSASLYKAHIHLTNEETEALRGRCCQEGRVVLKRNQLVKATL